MFNKHFHQDCRQVKLCLKYVNTIIFLRWSTMLASGKIQRVFSLWGLPSYLSWLRICLQCRRPQLDSWVRKICWRRDRLPSAVFLGYPCGSAGKESRRHGFDPWIGKIPWRRERLPIPAFWPGEFHVLYSPWGPIELDTTEWLPLSHFSL